MDRKFSIFLLIIGALLASVGSALGVTQLVGHAQASMVKPRIVIVHSIVHHPLEQPATPPPGAATPAVITTSLESQMANAVFDAINKDREAARLPVLKWSEELRNSAHAHSLAMDRAQKLLHQVPGEPYFGDRDHNAGVKWWWAGENIGMTTNVSTDGALGIHAVMMAEAPPGDEHRQNILTKNGNILGVDIVIDRHAGQVWLTEDFAQVS